VNGETLAEAITALYGTLQGRMQERWKRDLPFAELLFDRWDRARSLGFGEGSSAYHLSYFYGDVRVGEHAWIGPYTLIDGSGGSVTIGNYCVISAGVHVYTHDTVAWAVSGGRAPYVHAPVVIEDCCYLGAQVIVAKGVRIGAHSVIGAGSFVNHDIPPYAVAVGSPARVVGRVEIDDGTVTLRYDRKEGD
jgi:acetyltransferase-like isoleucine patch superfamily enzyme